MNVSKECWFFFHLWHDLINVKWAGCMVWEYVKLGNWEIYVPTSCVSLTSVAFLLWLKHLFSVLLCYFCIPYFEIASYFAKCRQKKILANFFNLCPNAETCMQVPKEEIQEVIKTLGLQVKRSESLQHLSREYLDGN